MRRIGMEEVAEMIGTSVSTLRKHVYGYRTSTMFEGLPDPCVKERRPKRGKVMWIDADIQAWLESQRTFKPKAEQAEQIAMAAVTTPPRRKAGRPRKMAAAIPSYA